MALTCCNVTWAHSRQLKISNLACTRTYEDLSYRSLLRKSSWNKVLHICCSFQEDPSWPHTHIHQVYEYTVHVHKAQYTRLLSRTIFLDKRKVAGDDKICVTFGLSSSLVIQHFSGAPYVFSFLAMVGTQHATYPPYLYRKGDLLT